MGNNRSNVSIVPRFSRELELNRKKRRRNINDWWKWLLRKISDVAIIQGAPNFYLGVYEGNIKEIFEILCKI